MHLHTQTYLIVIRLLEFLDSHNFLCLLVPTAENHAIGSFAHYAKHFVLVHDSLVAVALVALAA